MPITTPRRKPAPPPRWRRLRRVVLLASLICLIPASLSYLQALSGFHNVSFSIASVEWMRSHGGNGIVSEIEDWYYTLTAPSKGGPALRSLPRVGVAEGGEAPPPAYRPPTIKPLIHPALPGEGVWRPAGARAGARPPVLLTSFRSDPEYPQFVAGVAWIDTKRTRLDYVPGLAEPPNRSPIAAPPRSLRAGESRSSRPSTAVFRWKPRTRD